jgi:hyperosmotically inducible protein
MNTKLAIVPFSIGLSVLGLAGCASNRAPDVSGNIRNSLKQAGLNSVTVTDDRNKGVVTLAGNVKLDADKARAEQIAQPLAAGQVVADEIAVLPNGNASTAKTVNADLDKGIEANPDAALTEAHLKGVSHSTRNGVVTLKGDLPTPDQRSKAEQIATGVPNVEQVVNEIDVKNQRATTSYSYAERSK